MAEQTGVCRGGPFDGLTVTATGEPFLATDRRDGKAWLYQPDGSGGYQVDTGHDSTLVLPEGDITGERALNWDRLDTSPLREIPAVDVEENHAGHSVDDGWVEPPVPPG